jgi:hypothetical protein
MNCKINRLFDIVNLNDKSVKAQRPPSGTAVAGQPRVLDIARRYA